MLFLLSFLQVGECSANVSSKKYLSESHYTCQYDCRESANKIVKLWLVHADLPKYRNEMSAFLCWGVEIEERVVVGSITTPTPVTYPFSAFKSSSPELIEWLKLADVRPSPDLKNKYDQEFFKNLSEMSRIYKLANSEAFKAAGQVLERIVNRDEKLLKIYIEKLRERNWNLIVDYRSSDDIVMFAILTHGRYLDYTEITGN
jgi:hypothetical protein